MEFLLLGSLEVRDGTRRIDLPRAKQRALLAALLLRRGEAVSVDRLLEDLWGERPPPAAVGSLHNLVSALRKLLGAETIRTRPPGYALEVEPEQVDLFRFTRLVGEAQEATDPETRASLLRRAVSLWRGPPLADLAFEPFAAVEIARLEDLHLGAREDLVDAELALGRHAAVIGELEALIAEQPFRERPRELLMLALYRAGRQSDALEAFAAARRFLDDELGLEPGPKLKGLQQAILRQDPRLDPAPVRPGATPAEPRRKTVTVVCTDLVDSTSLAEALDPEAYRALLRRYYETVRTVLERHGGTVDRFLGEAVVAVFGVPRRHEDDALRAVRAAVEARVELARLDAELARLHHVTIRVRTGVNTGEVIAGGADPADSVATGHAVNVAAKLQQVAPPGGILVGPATYRLVRDAVLAEEAVDVPLGRSTLPAFPIGDVVGPDGVARNLAAPFVGRAEELGALRHAFEEARERSTCRVVTVTGEAGIGKSRLVLELVADLGTDAAVAVGSCVSYGEGVAYAPLADVVRVIAPGGSEAAIAAPLGAGPDARSAARQVRELLGWAEGATPAAEGHAAVRRLLSAVAAARPLVVVLEDVHWAEPALLDFVEDLRAHPGGAPLLVVCLARPDLLETRAGWEADVRLRPLSPERTAELLRSLEGSVALTAEAQRRIVAVSEGNPLYAEQLLGQVADEGTQGLEDVPEGVEAVLAARLERLDEPERAVLERAAVAGREFTRPLVASLSGRPVEAELAQLRQRGFVQPSGRAGLRFQHVLIRDVAYGAITKARRAELHERVADWLEDRGETAEIVGYHLEQAHRCRVAVAGVDEHARAVGRRAGAHLSEAGLRALAREDSDAAIKLLGRALLLVDDEERRAHLLAELGVAHRLHGDGGAAARVLRTALEAASTRRSRPAEARVRVELAHAGLYGVGDLRATPADVLAAAEAAIPLLEEVEDVRGLARAWLALADARSFPLAVEAWAEAAARAHVYYERSGFSPAAALGIRLGALYWGPRPVPEAIAEAQRLVAPHAGDASLVVATASTFVAGLEAMRKRFDVADDLVASARRILDERRAGSVVAGTWVSVTAEIARLRGDLPGAAELLREACDGLAAMEHYATLATAAARYADVLITLEEDAEAERLVELSRGRAAADDVASQALWRAAAARLAARREDVHSAQVLAREAAALVDGSDASSLRAKTLLDAAEALRLTGAAPEAAELVEAAIGLYEAKGNVAGAEEAAALRRTSAAAR